ncbi:hypothetical protein B566_EDAN013621 [Ephemera danica]|nr:hypothetical protein B566_EDAN013621 [Ephemera danica]
MDALLPTLILCYKDDYFKININAINIVRFDIYYHNLSFQSRFKPILTLQRLRAICIESFARNVETKSNNNMPPSQFYLKSMAAIGKHVPPRFQPLWIHPAGPQTVHFWGPLVKWYSSLAVTGFIWARYCLVIIPKNYSLCAVNFFVGLTGLYQVSRAMFTFVNQQKY